MSYVPLRKLVRCFGFGSLGCLDWQNDLEQKGMKLSSAWTYD
jgi:hypothetical protein